MTETPPEMQLRQAEIQEAASFVEPLRAAIGQTLVGQSELVDCLLIGLLTGGHVLVEGLPGLAKTLAVKTLAAAVGGRFSRLQFTPDLLPADLIGTTVYNPGDHSFTVKPGPIFANLILADEVNRAPAKVQSALLEAMQERQVTIGGESRPLPFPFLVMATQNPIEHEGTYNLPEAQIDRFMLKARVDYPEREEEREIMRRMAHPEPPPPTAPVLRLEQIGEARKAIDQVYLDPKIEEYILDLTIATRPRHGRPIALSERQSQVRLERIEELVEFGASPRATLALALAAKAKAFLQVRAYVVPRDVKDVAPQVLRHRLILNYEAEAENMTGHDLVAWLLGELRTP